MSGFSSLYEKVYERLPITPSGATYRRLESFGGSRVRSARLPMIVAAFTLSGLFFVFLSSYSSSSPEWSSPTGHVHLLVPASNPDPNFCKVVVSGAILGYPAPQAINWGVEFNNSHLSHGGSHLAKIDGVKSYLDNLKPYQDDDLVLMVDGYDTWFQLRPQTMLDRYFDINRRANERLRQEFGAKTMKKHNIKQDIIFSSQKRCWPGGPQDPNCYAIPQSTLPDDAFGNGTDTDIGNRENPYIAYRPRYLNSGVAIGTVKAMRSLFTESLIRAKQDPSTGSDQRIFSKIFGHQEIWREVLRRREMSWYQRLHIFFSGIDPQGELFRLEDVEAAKFKNYPMEFNVGLDYESSVSIPTVFSEHDTEWITFNNETQLAEADAKKNIPKEDTRLIMADDIVNTMPPFQTAENVEGLPTASWRDVSIFTDVWTGYAPVVIHHNAHINNSKQLRVTWWDRIWFQKYARQMMDAYMKEPMGVLAFSGGREWRGADEFKGGVRDDAGAWLPYQDICKDTEDEVFRDGKGPWIAEGHGN